MDGSTQGIRLHILIYGIQLFTELREMRRQYKNNKLKVFYLSKGIQHFELFFEFLYEILHEKDEPIALFFEVIKSGLKLNEFYQLMTKEKGLHTYLELESYREFIICNEIKQENILLMRTKRRVEKLHNLQLNQQY